MEYLYERISYLKGLAEGLGINEGSKEGKLLLHIVDTLEDFADVINDTLAEQEDLGEYVEYIDEDLADVEDEVFREIDEDELLDEYDDEYEDQYINDQDIDYIEMECPSCHEVMYLDRELLDRVEETECPNCHEKIITSFEEEEEE